MSDENPFNAAGRSAMREEIRRHGLVADKFLASNPDVPTFGLNLAGAWPFPETGRGIYERMAMRLNAIGPELYVYPFEFTHVTLMTLVSFARHTRPEVGLVKKLEEKIPGILMALAPLLTEKSSEQIKPFTLQPQPLVLSRTAAILPWSNPDGEVTRLRRRTMELLRGNDSLHRELIEHGLNVPGIIHTTVMRFRQPPRSLEKFLATFDEITTETKFPPLEIVELLLTTETKPYMRGGRILQRFELQAS